MPCGGFDSRLDQIHGSWTASPTASDPRRFISGCADEYVGHATRIDRRHARHCGDVVGVEMGPRTEAHPVMFARMTGSDALISSRPTAHTQRWKAPSLAICMRLTVL